MRSFFQICCFTLIIILVIFCYGSRYSAGYTIYALKYAESEYPANLINTKQKTALVTLNWLAYLVKDPTDRLTLIDCGFSEQNLVKRFKLRNFKPVHAILTDLQIKPEKISTIVITHTHFDHALDMDKYPNAKIFLHRHEADNPLEPLLAPRLKVAQNRGRLFLFESPLLLESGLKLIPVRGHTPGSTAVWLKQPKYTAVFTGDECYSAAACQERIPLPKVSAHSVASNEAFMKSIIGIDWIFAGHETDLQRGQWLNRHVFLVELPR